jgi:hypothetical protein
LLAPHLTPKLLNSPLYCRFRLILTCTQLISITGDRCLSVTRGCNMVWMTSDNIVGVCNHDSCSLSKDEAQNLLGCTAVFLTECRPTFQRYVLPPSSGRSKDVLLSTCLADIILSVKCSCPTTLRLYACCLTTLVLISSEP